MRRHIVAATRLLLLFLVLHGVASWAQDDMHHQRPQINSSEESLSGGMTMDNEMQMQGGNAPANARDPHAYANGYTLESGPYVLPGPRQLKLADEHHFWGLLGNRLEYDDDSGTGVFDLQGWYGTTYDRVTVKLEGDVANHRLEESQTDIQWTHAISAYFDSELGVRFDQYDEGPDRQWLALGVQGLAPYWIELDVTGYIGDEGRTALTIEADYEWLLTQRWALQHRLEINGYGRSDPENGIGSGISNASLGVRLRYEISRQFAPYLGIERWQKYGHTADLAGVAGEKKADTVYLAGVRFWF